jgi:hypothetical protein
METRIICYANEKDCRCFVELPGLEPEDKRRLYEVIYGKFNRFAFVTNIDGTILIKNIEN